MMPPTTNDLAHTRHVPPLRFRALTGLYDAVIRLLVRERALRTQLLESVPLPPEGAALDLGCGTGSFLGLLRQRYPAVHAVGIDPDEAALGIARGKLAGRGIELRRGSASHLPFQDQSFDAVFSSLMFHHLPAVTTRDALLEARRVLRIGGTLRVVDWGPPGTPLLAVPFAMLRLFDGIENTRKNARGEIPGMLSGAGFRNVRLTGSLNTVFGTLSFMSAVRAG